MSRLKASTSIFVFLAVSSISLADLPKIPADQDIMAVQPLDLRKTALRVRLDRAARQLPVAEAAHSVAQWNNWNNSWTNWNNWHNW